MQVSKKQCTRGINKISKHSSSVCKDPQSIAAKVIDLDQFINLSICACVCVCVSNN